MKKRLLSLFLVLAFVLTLVPVLMPGASADTPALDLENNKNTALNMLNLNTAAPSELNKAGNPYGEGWSTLNPFHELYVSWVAKGSNDTTRMHYDADKSTSKAITDESLLSSKFNAGSKVTSRTSGNVNTCYTMSWGGDFKGEGKANYIAELATSDWNLGTVTLRIVDAKAHTLVGGASVELYDQDLSGDIRPWELSAFLSAAVGDFNNDGRDEIAVYDIDAGDNGAVVIYALRDNDTLEECGRIALPEAPGTLNGSSTSRNKWVALNLAAGDLNRDGVDDLAIAMSYHKSAFTLESSDERHASRILVCHGSKSGLTEDFDSGGVKFRFEENSNLRYLRYAAVSIGDVDGNGANELVVGGFYSEAGKWSLITDGDRHPRSAISYYEYTPSKEYPKDYTIKIGTSSGGVTAGGFSYFDAPKGNGQHMAQIYNDEDTNQSPVALTTFKADGNGHAEKVFLQGRILKTDGQSKFADEASGTKAITDEAAIGPNKSNRWFAQAVAGNFSGDPLGKESVIYISASKYSGEDVYYYDVDSIFNKGDAGSPSWVCQANQYHKERSYMVSLAPVDVDDDGARVRFESKSFYFTDPKIIAVLQAAPHFAELDALDDGYSSSGETAFSKSKGDGTSVSQSVSVSAGIVVGFEQDISIMGFGDIGGVEMEATVSASMGYEYQEDTEKTYTTTVSSASDEDRVALAMIPYVKYNYQIFVPEYTLPTEDTYKTAKDKVAELEETLKTLPVDDEQYVKLAQQYADKIALCEKMEKALASGYTYKQIIPAHTEPYSVSLPAGLRTSVLTVDQYEEVAEQFADMDSIRDKALPPKYQIGDPGSYRKSTAGLNNVEEGKNVLNEDSDDWMTVSNAGSGSTFSQEITEAASSSHGITWGASASFSSAVSAGGVKTGTTFETSYEGGYAWVKTSETTFSGTVASMPKDAGNDYGFQWRFFGHKAKLNGMDCLVLEYLVKDVTAPPSAVQNLDVEEVTTDSVTLTWDFGSRKAESYTIFRYNAYAADPYTALDNVDGTTTEYTDVNCNENTDYTYVVKSRSGDRESVYSSMVTAHTLSKHGAPKVSVTEPESVRPGTSPTLSATVTPMSGGTNPTYRWQINTDGTWKNAPNTNNSVNYSILNVKDSMDGTRYRCVVSQIVNNVVVQGVSNTVKLKVGKGSSVTGLTLSETSGLATVTTVEAGETIKIPYSLPITASLNGTTYNVYQYVPTEGSSSYYLQAQGDAASKPMIAVTSSDITAIQTEIAKSEAVSGETVNLALTGPLGDSYTPDTRIQLSDSVTVLASTLTGGSPVSNNLGSGENAIACESYTEYTVSEVKVYVASFKSQEVDDDGVSKEFTYTQYYIEDAATAGAYIIPEMQGVYANGGTTVPGSALELAYRSWEVDSTGVGAVTTTPGTSIKLTARVAEDALPGGTPVVPTGTVVFEISNISDSSNTTRFTIPVSGNTAVKDWVAPAEGIYRITAHYSGDDVLNPSSSISATYMAYVSDTKPAMALQITAPSRLVYGETLAGNTGVTLLTGSTGAQVTTNLTYAVYDSTNTVIGSSLTDILIPGSYSVVATYTEDPNNTPENLDDDKKYTARHTFTVTQKPITVEVVTDTISLDDFTGELKSYGRVATEGEIKPTDAEALVVGDTLNPEFFWVSCELMAVPNKYPILLSANTQEEPDAEKLKARTEFHQKYAVTYLDGTQEVIQEGYGVVFKSDSRGSISARYGLQSFAMKSDSTKIIPVGNPLTFTSTPQEGWTVRQWKVGGVPYTESNADKGITIIGNTLSLTMSGQYALDKVVTVEVAHKIKSSSLSYEVYQGDTEVDKQTILTAALESSPGSPITSGSTVASGKPVVFTAKVPDGWVIDRWVVGDTTVETDNGANFNGSTYRIESVTGDTTVKLYLAADEDFEVLSRVATYEGAPLNGCKVTAEGVTGGTAAKGSTITFTASETSDDALKEWRIYETKADYIAKINATAITTPGMTYTVENLSKALYVEAVFSPTDDALMHELTFSVAGDEGQNTLTAKAGLTPVNSGGELEAGTQVNFTLTLNADYYVVSWKGAVASNSDKTKAVLTSLDAATEVIVTVAKKPSLIWNTPENGTITVEQDGKELESPAKVSPNSSVTVTLKPNEGYVVEKLIDDGGNRVTLTADSTASDDMSTVIESITEDTELTGSFKELDTHGIAFSIDNGDIEAAASRKGMDIYDAPGKNGTITVYEGGEVSFTATPTPGSRIAGWKIGNNETDETQVSNVLTLSWAELENVDAVVAVTETGDARVTFANPANGTLTATIGDSAESFTSGGIPADDDTITFKVVPEDGYVLDGWYVNGEKQTEETNTFAYIYDKDTSAHIEVVLVAKSLKISVGKTGEGAVSSTPKVTTNMRYGDSLTLTATPADGWEFKGWKKDGSFISGAGASYDAGVQTADATYTAVFEKPAAAQRYTLKFTSTDASKGSVSATAGDQAVQSGDRITAGAKVVLTASPASGYKVSGWSGLPAAATTNESKTTATIANFSANATVTVSFESTGGASIGDGGGGGGGGGAVTPTPGPSGDDDTSLGDTTITGDNGKPPEKTEDGVILPSGGTVTTDDENVIVKVPDGTEVNKDGTIIIPENKEADVTLKGGTTVTVPGGSTINGNQVIIGKDGGTIISKGKRTELDPGTVIVLDEAVALGWFVAKDFWFEDVPLNSWFYDDVKYVYERGLMAGISDTLFAPNDPVTRGMVVTVLWRLEGEPEATEPNPFTDLTQDWYQAAVVWAAEEGVVLGYGDGRYGPEDLVTREQLAAILYRYAGSPAVTSTPLAFGDAGSITPYAVNAMIWTTGEGIITGKPGNLLDPQGNTLRAELAAMLHRYMTN